MAIFPTIKEISEEVAVRVLDEYIYKGKTLRQLIDALAQSKWIPVSERLPQPGQEVICQCRADMIKVLKLDANFDWYQDAEHCYMGGFVVAWMPLPKAYKAEGENET